MSVHYNLSATLQAYLADPETLETPFFNTKDNEHMSPVASDLDQTETTVSNTYESESSDRQASVTDLGQPKVTGSTVDESENLDPDTTSAEEGELRPSFFDDIATLLNDLDLPFFDIKYDSTQDHQE